MVHFFPTGCRICCRFSAEIDRGCTLKDAAAVWDWSNLQYSVSLSEAGTYSQTLEPQLLISYVISVGGSCWVVWSKASRANLPAALMAR